MTFNVLRIDPNVLRLMANALHDEDSEEYQILMMSASYIDALERLVFWLDGAEP